MTLQSATYFFDLRAKAAAISLLPFAWALRLLANLTEILAGTSSVMIGFRVCLSSATHGVSDEEKDRRFHANLGIPSMWRAVWLNTSRCRLTRQLESSHEKCGDVPNGT
jgi:hypothetical protein